MSHKYKTKICRFYVNGRCVKGDSCTYVHDPNCIQNSGTIGTALQAEPEVAESPALAPSAATPPPIRNIFSATTSTTDASQPVSTASQLTNDSEKKRPKRGELPCFAWRKGSCAKGEKCWYSHDAMVQPMRAATQATRGHATDAVRVDGEMTQVRGEARKRAVASLRARTEREAVRAREALEAQERAEAAARAQAELEAQVRAEAAARAQADLEARRRVEAVARERERQARIQADREARERAEAVSRERQRVLEEQERARLEEQARLDAAKTTQRVVLGSIVTFGSGLEVSGFTTGFESCIIRIRGIPENALEREIYALFTQQGINKAQLYLMLNKSMRDGTRDVKMAMDAESGHALSVGLDELEFRDRRLSFEVGTYNIPGTMGASSVKDAEVLTVSWQAASVRYVAAYDSLADARRKIQELNDSTHFGRRLRVETNTAPPGRLLYIDPNSIKIDNLPASVTHDQVSIIAGPEALSLRALPTRGAPVTAAPLDIVRTSILASGCSLSDVVSLDLAELASDTLQGTVKVRARFSTWDHAKTVHDYFSGRKLFGNVTCRVTLPSPLSYMITVPLQQFQAQRNQWAALRDSAQVVGRDQCSLAQIDVAGKPIVRFRVSGSDKKTVGALKVQVEGLAAGERVDGWHVRLSQHSNSIFVARVLAESGALMRADWRQRQLKVYGGPQAVARAREMIAEELTRLAGLELTTNVPPASVRHFLAQGLPELRELLGDDNVHFNPATRILVTSGGDETHHIVSRILEQASRSRAILPSAAEDTCPICFDNVSAPIRLGCGHAYCSTCLRHFISSASDSDKFPLLCMGNEAHCNIPIPIPCIERFLSQPLFTRLLEATFRAHVSQRPLELKYCRTPDCEQIYRVAPQGGPRPVPAQCPACLSVVCPGCHEDAHEGLTCEEHRVQSNPAEQERLVDEWIASQGGRVKKCPQCKVLMEKIDGCNHMTCRCGAHVCWRCLGVFSRETIYEHMGTAHGGYYAEDHAVNAPVDYAEQERLLRQAADARRAAEARRVAEVERAAEARRANAARAEMFWRPEAEANRVRADQQQREWLDRLREQTRRQVAAEAARMEEERRRQNQGNWCTIM